VPTVSAPSPTAITSALLTANHRSPVFHYKLQSRGSCLRSTIPGILMTTSRSVYATHCSSGLSQAVRLFEFDRFDWDPKLSEGDQPPTSRHGWHHFCHNLRSMDRWNGRIKPTFSCMFVCQISGTQSFLMTICDQPSDILLTWDTDESHQWARGWHTSQPRLAG
jgi:hypothetical protein